jgi:hypothetical protein
MVDKPENTGEKQARDEKGRFLEGVSGNPEGKPKGSKNQLTLLEEALIEEAEKSGKTYWQKLAEWCFINPKVAVAILKKFIPDKSSMEVSGESGPIEFIIRKAESNDKK